MRPWNLPPFWEGNTGCSLQASSIRRVVTKVKVVANFSFKVYLPCYRYHLSPVTCLNIDVTLLGGRIHACRPVQCLQNSLFFAWACVCAESCCSLDHQESRCNALDTRHPLSKTGPWLQVLIGHPTSTAAQTLILWLFWFPLFWSVLLTPTTPHLNQLNSTNTKSWTITFILKTFFHYQPRTKPFRAIGACRTISTLRSLRPLEVRYANANAMQCSVM